MMKMLLLICKLHRQLVEIFMQRYEMQLSSSESAMAVLLLKLLIALNRFPLLFIIRKKKMMPSPVQKILSG